MLVASGITRARGCTRNGLTKSAQQKCPDQPWFKTEEDLERKTVTKDVLLFVLMDTTALHANLLMRVTIIIIVLLNK